VSADPEADAYTIGQVAAGLPFANAVATGHAHNPGYIAYTSYPAASYGVPYGAGLHYIGKRSADAYTLGQVAAGLPWANAVASGRAHNPGYIAYVSYPGAGPAYAAPGHFLGKRSADAYTIGQVAAGLPFANAVATGHAHNPGYIRYTEYPASAGVYSAPYAAAPYAAAPYAAAPYAGAYGALPYYG
jgi:hypothetical protein